MPAVILRKNPSWRKAFGSGSPAFGWQICGSQTQGVAPVPAGEAAGAGSAEALGAAPSVCAQDGAETPSTRAAAAQVTRQRVSNSATDGCPVRHRLVVKCASQVEVEIHQVWDIVCFERV